MAAQYCTIADHSHGPAHLVVAGISVAYGKRPVLTDVSFCISEGGRVAVVGPNGAGKSTLFKALMGLLPVSRGSIRIHDLPLGSHMDCVAYIPQREEVDWKFPVTVADVVMMGRYGRLGWGRRPGKRDRAAVASCIDQLGLSSLADQPINRLSGGQQQRVFLARALAQEPHILLMDEPFTGVDISTQESTLAIFDQLQERSVTVLASTHDLTLAATGFDQVMLLNHRVISYGAPSEALTAKTLAEAFGGQVLFVEGAAAVGRNNHCTRDGR